MRTREGWARGLLITSALLFALPLFFAAFVALAAATHPGGHPSPILGLVMLAWALGLTVPCLGTALSIAAVLLGEPQARWLRWVALSAHPALLLGTYCAALLLGWEPKELVDILIRYMTP